MKKTEKLFILILAFSIILSLLVGCKKKNNGKEEPSDGEDGVVFSSSVDAVLVLGQDISENSVKDLKSAYFNATGKSVNVVTSSAESKAHEIIVGECDREASRKAYRFLATLEKEDEEDVGYVIYSDGTSVAIAFNAPSYGVDISFNEAKKYFIEKCLVSKTLKPGVGILKREAFDPVERQMQREDESLKRLWDIKREQIIERLSGDEARADKIIEMLTSIHEIYDSEGIASWLANLYDPVSGGFYYSNSARNNVGYLPDLESTSQALGIVEALLIDYEGTLKDYFGDEIASGFVKFAKDMQSAESGYFYHPQWSRDLIDKTPERRDRDLNNALYILDSFGASPTYDVAGVKGDGKRSDGTVAPVSALVQPLLTHTSSVVSLVSDMAGDEIYFEPHLRSEEAFRNYLDSLYIGSKPAEAGSALEAQAKLILYRDSQLAELGESYRLADICLETIGKYQNSSSGLWTSGSKPTYNDVSNSYRLMRVYNALGYTIPRARQILSTANNILTNNSEEISKMEELVSIWSTVSTVITNLRTYGMSTDKVSSILTIDILYNNLPEMLRVTNDNLQVFSKIDGSFSGERKFSAATSSGVSVAVANTEEGDVNATILATKNLWLSIFNVFGIGTVPIYNVSDRMLFQKTLAEMGVIIKNEIVSAPPLDFEDYEDGDDYTNLYRAMYSDGASILVKTLDDERGNVLNIKSTPISGYIDQYRFPLISSTPNATCYIFDVDLCVLPGTSEGYFGQLYIYPDTYMIYLRRNGDTISIYEESSRSSAVSYSRDLGSTAKVGEWFNIRVEYYPGNDETVRIKIYFNGECIAVTDNYFDSPPQKFDGAGVPNNNYGSFAFYALQNYNVDILFDNIVAERNYKAYVAETSDSLVRNVDAPECDRIIHSFENTESGRLPSGFEINGDASGFTTERTSEGGVLSIIPSSSNLKIPINVRGPKTNSALVAFDLNVDPTSAPGASYSVTFKEYIGKGRTFAEFLFYVEELDGKKHLGFGEGKSGKLLNSFSNVKLTLGETHRIEMRLYSDDDVALLYINGELAGINTSALASQKKFYMGEVYISSLKPDINSSAWVDNLVCERIKGSYADVSAPKVDRVTHTFDSFGTLENSGLSIESGELVFENAKKGSFIKIPINERSDIPTLGYASIDVNVSYKMGTLILYFKDKSDTIVSAFALVPTDDGCKLYEVTENGIYPTPISEISGTQFRLSFEYSYVKRGFSVLVGGQYVACTSIPYNDASTDGDLKILEIVPLDSGVGMKLDNVVFESSSALFKVPTLSNPNPDDTAPTITYESSSFASLSSKISNNYLSSTGSSLLIKEKKLRGSVTKVLEFNSGNDARDYVMFALTDKRAGGNAVAFETDMMLVTTGNRLTGEFCPKSRDFSAYRLWISMNEGGKLNVSSADFNETFDIVSGEWFTLRYEYAATHYDFNYDGSIDVLVYVYIDGKLIGTGYTPYSTPPVSSDSIVEMRLGVDANRGGKIYFDNTKFESCNVHISEPIPPDKEILTYEPGAVTNKTVGTFKSSIGNLKIVEKTVISKVSKVLAFTTGKGGEDNLKIALTQTLEGANAVSFESDLMIEPNSFDAVFYLDPILQSGNCPFRLVFTVDSLNNVKLSSSNGGIEEKIIGKAGEWIHLRVEYMNPMVDYDSDRRLDILYKVYIGGNEVPIAIGYKPYSESSYFTPEKLTHVRITSTSNTDATLYLDNTAFWQVNLVPDKAPTTEDSEKNGNLGRGDILDREGWT